MGAVARSLTIADAAAIRCAQVLQPVGKTSLATKRVSFPAEASRRDDRYALAPSSLATVMQQYQGSVYAYLRARLLEPADAEDLSQEVFLRFYLGREKLGHSVPLQAWLLGIARNLLREHVRRVSRRREVSWPELCLELESMAEDPLSYCDETLALLPECLQALGPSAREALDLRYKAQFSIAEIANHLCRSKGAVKLLLYRARQALKHSLGRKLEKSRDE